MRFFMVFLLSIYSISLFSNEIGNSFIFNESKLDVGTLYTYDTSDFDGNELIQEYIYIKDKGSIETLRNFFYVGKGLWLTKEKIDKEFFMFGHSTFETLISNSDEYTVFSNLEYDYRSRKASVIKTRSIKGENKKKNRTWNLSSDTQYPFYQVGNCTTDIAIFFKFLNFDEKESAIGFNDVFGSKERYIVSYEKDEVIDGALCKKYRLYVDGLFAKMLDKSGAIWIKKDDPYQTVIKFVLNQRISKTLKNQKSILRNTQKLTPSQWESFIQEKKNSIEEELEF